MSLDKKVTKTPYFWLDEKPDVWKQDYLFNDVGTKSEPVQTNKVKKLMSFLCGCFVLFFSVIPPVLAYREFSTNASALFWIFMFGFWLVLVYMTFNLKGLQGDRIGILSILQLMFGIVIGLNFIEFSLLIAVGVMATSGSIFIAFMFGSR